MEKIFGDNDVNGYSLESMINEGLKMNRKSVRRAMVVSRDVNDYFERVNIVMSICDCSMIDAKKLLADFDSPPFDHGCNLLWRRLAAGSIKMRSTLNTVNRTVILFGRECKLFSYKGR